MGLIDRFVTSFRSEDRGGSEPPGLVQNDDGTVDVIQPDGSRGRVGNGGSLPATGGTLAPTDPAAVPLTIQPAVGAVSAEGESNAFVINDPAGSPVFYVDAGGDLQATLSSDLGFGGASTWEIDADGKQLVIFSPVTGFLFRLPPICEFVILNDSGAPIFRVDDDGTVHIKTGSSILSDL